MVEMVLTKFPRQAADEELAIRARSGDADAFALLIDRYRDTTFAYAASILRNRDDAEDAAQEAFVRAYLALDRFRAGGCWCGWLMRIVQNVCRDHLRRSSVRGPYEISPLSADTAPTPEQRLLEIEGSRYLNARLWGLPDKFRIPLLMKYAHQRSYKEIADALGIPVSTVMGRLAGALRILRRQMQGVEI